MTFDSFARLHGIIVPMVTPLMSVDVLDLDALEILIEHLITGGVHGLFILGSCGEGPSLSYHLRRELVERTCRQVNGRLPILVGITDSSAIEADSISQYAADCGADAVVIAPPFYFPINREELIDFSRRRIRKSPLPVVLYNMPSLTKLSYDSECLSRLADEKKVIAIKDSSGDIGVFQRLVDAARVRDDWTVLVGPEQLLITALQLGGHGGVSGGANLFPSLFVQIYASVHDTSSAIFKQFAGCLKTLGSIYEIAGSGAPSAVRALKTGLAALGIGNGLPSEPLMSLDRDRTQKISQIVTDLANELSAGGLPC